MTGWLRLFGTRGQPVCILLDPSGEGFLIGRFAWPHVRNDLSRLPTGRYSA
jgi:hypothetical protein